MKKTAILFILYLLVINCCAQQIPSDFDKFISNFKKCDLLIEPSKFFLVNEENMQTKHISKNEFDKYLRTAQDNLWKFTNDFDYIYGARFIVFDQYIGLFYGRYYMPENIDKQIGEIVLCVFSKEGKMISNIPVGGGYGDNLTFSSIIHSPLDIEVNYIEYQKNKEKKYTKHYSITKDGLIIGKQ